MILYSSHDNSSSCYLPCSALMYFCAISSVIFTNPFLSQLCREVPVLFMPPVVFVTELWIKGEACRSRPENFFQGKCYVFLSTWLKSTFCAEKYHHLKMHSCWHTSSRSERNETHTGKAQMMIKKKVYIHKETEKECQKMQFDHQKSIFQRNLWNVDRISIKRIILSSLNGIIWQCSVQSAELWKWNLLIRKR